MIVGKDVGKEESQDYRRELERFVLRLSYRLQTDLLESHVYIVVFAKTRVFKGSKILCMN